MHEKFRPKETDPIFEQSRKTAKEKLDRIMDTSFIHFAVRAMNISEFEKVIADGRVEDGREVYLPNHYYQHDDYKVLPNRRSLHELSMEDHSDQFENYKYQTERRPLPGGREWSTFAQYVHREDWAHRIGRQTLGGYLVNKISRHAELMNELHSISAQTKGEAVGKDRRERILHLIKEKMLEPYQPLTQRFADLQKVYDERANWMQELGVSSESSTQIQEVLNEAERENSYDKTKSQLFEIRSREKKEENKIYEKLKDEEDKLWADEEKRQVDAEKKWVAQGNWIRRDTTDKGLEEHHWYLKKINFLDRLHKDKPSQLYKESKTEKRRWHELEKLFQELEEYFEFKTRFGNKKMARFIECVKDENKLLQPGAVKDVLHALLQLSGDKGARHYNVAVILDISAVGKPNHTSQWGFIHLSEEDKEPAAASAKILAVVGLYGDPVLTEKLVQLSSHAKEAACPVFTSKGTKKFP